MGLFTFFGKGKAASEISERSFECQRGGLTIRGTEYRPAGDDLPAAIVCHGLLICLS